MNKNTKLLLTGLVFLFLGFAMGPLLDALGGEGKAPEPVASAKPDNGLGLEQLSELRAAEIPEELAITERYLTNRWGHMGEVPQVATGTTAGGEQWVRNKKVIVGRRGDGKLIYAHSFAMAHRFRGELFNADNPANMQGATATVEGFTPTGSGLNYETIDLEDLPGAGPGHRACQRR